VKKSLIIVFFLLTLQFICTFAPVAQAAPDAENDAFALHIDGKPVHFFDQQPVLMDYSGEKVLYVPVRDTCKALGFDVVWDEKTKSAVAAKKNMVIIFPNGEEGQYVNGVFQGLDRPVVTKNGRTLVSAMFLTKAFGYILSWDDISKVLNAISPESFGNEFICQQSTHKDANLFSEEYNDFSKVWEKAFIIPGLNEYVVPQGITYRKDTEQFILSGYFKAKALNSVIFVIDAKTGKSEGEYYLCNSDKTPFYGHVGGIAVTDKNLYIANGKSVYRVSLSTLDSLGNKANLYPEETIKLSFGASNSFIDFSGGYLFVGNFYEPDTADYSKKAHESYGALIRAYKLDNNTENGFSDEKRTTNTSEYDYIPHMVYKYDKLKIQGITTHGNKMFFSASSGSWGEMYLCDIPTPDNTKESIVLDGDKTVPVYTLTLRNTLLPIPRMEEIVIAHDNIYAAFESGAIIYRFTSKGSTTDSVWKIPVNTLLSES